jgi:hypothetical protein
MAGNIGYSICYLIEGESTPDLLEISSTASVRALKKQIQEENNNGVLRGIDARYLTLRKAEVPYQQFHVNIYEN